MKNVLLPRYCSNKVICFNFNKSEIFCINHKQRRFLILPPLMLKVKTSSFPIFLSPWIIKVILCHFACYDVTASSWSRSQRQVGAFLRHRAGTAEPSHGSVCSMGHVTVTYITHVTWEHFVMPTCHNWFLTDATECHWSGAGTVCDNIAARNRAATLHSEIQGDQHTTLIICTV